MEKGFFQIPNNFFDALLISPLIKRQLKVVLLIYRLTHGCQQVWVKLKKADLIIVGIGSTHAGAILQQLVQQGIILQNEKNKDYRVNEDYFSSILTKTVTSEPDRLKKLVHQQLSRLLSQKGKSKDTQIVINPLPKQEVSAYQNSNPDPLPKREVSTSNKGGFTSAKDIINTTNISDKYSPIANIYKKDGGEE